MARQAAIGRRQAGEGARVPGAGGTPAVRGQGAPLAAPLPGRPAVRFVRVYGRPSRRYWSGVVWWGAAAVCAAACWASPLLGVVCIWAFVRAWDAARPYEQVELMGEEVGRDG